MGPGGGAPGGVITLPGGGGDAINASMANSNANTSGANDSSAADKSGASGTVASGGGGEDSSKFPKILLMGLRRSGKSSIQKVVFHKMSPNETLFLESTAQIVKDEVSNSSFVQFAVWDFPGQVDFFDPAFDAEKVFERCGAVVYVVDAQDDYTEAMQRLTQTVQKAFEAKPDIRFEVFIHKVRFFAFASNVTKFFGPQKARISGKKRQPKMLTFFIAFFGRFRVALLFCFFRNFFGKNNYDSKSATFFKKNRALREIHFLAREPSSKSANFARNHEIWSLCLQEGFNDSPNIGLLFYFFKFQI